jgi:hypothetical protein
MARANPIRFSTKYQGESSDACHLRSAAASLRVFGERLVVQAIGTGKGAMTNKSTPPNQNDRCAIAMVGFMERFFLRERVRAC